MVVPYGSAAEPATRAGWRWSLPTCSTKALGNRDALAFSQAIKDLGARLSSSADRDVSVVSLELLASKLDQGLPLLADAITRPRHDAKDWKRVQTLWINGLKARAHEPNEVARVVTSLEFYGEKHPDGHPPEGTLASSAKIQLGDISKWHRSIWRPDVAHIIVVGDVTKKDITDALGKAFASWKAPKDKPLATPELPAPATGALRTFVVDRADAPQVVMSIARPARR